MFATKLKERAVQLGLSNAEVARRADLTERRYGHYASGDREPDLATMVRIARVLQSSPNELVGFDATRVEEGPRQLLLARLMAAASQLSYHDLETCVIQMEAVAAARRS